MLNSFTVIFLKKNYHGDTECTEITQRSFIKFYSVFLRAFRVSVVNFTIFTHVKFSALIGHSEVKHRLIRSAQAKRVSHALLFLGSTGSGSLAMAIAFSQYLVCENPGEDDSCGECASCKKMAKLIHPDVSFSYPVAPKEKITKPRSVDFIAQWRVAILENLYLSYNEWMESLDLDNKQGIIAVHESADIINRLNLKSVEAPYKIVLIWLPERMNAEAANKLLKIIEEPPDNTFFFLIAENHELLLQTIISRTQLIKVNRISDSDMLEALVELYKLDKTIARRIVHRADGDFNEAKKLMEKDEGIADMNQKFLLWMRSCLRLNVQAISEFSQEFGSGSRESQKNFLRHALAVARECLLINYGDRSLIRLEGKDLEDMKRFAPFVNENNLDAFTDEINKAHFHLERNANSKLLFTNLSFAIHSLLHKSGVKA
jgi:DNA polymerase-3 subunit delta'